MIQKTGRKAKQAQRMTDVLQRSNGQNESEQNGAANVTNCSKNVNNAKHFLTAFRWAALFRLPHNSLYLFFYMFFFFFVPRQTPRFPPEENLFHGKLNASAIGRNTKRTNHVRDQQSFLIAMTVKTCSSCEIQDTRYQIQNG